MAPVAVLQNGFLVRVEVAIGGSTVMFDATAQWAAFPPHSDAAGKRGLVAMQVGAG